MARNTFTVQQSAHSGETFVLQWDRDDLVGICGPLTSSEQEQAIADIESANGFEYEDATGVGSDPDDWQSPDAIWDPNTGEVYRA